MPMVNKQKNPKGTEELINKSEVSCSISSLPFLAQSQQLDPVLYSFSSLSPNNMFKSQFLLVSFLAHVNKKGEFNALMLHSFLPLLSVLGSYIFGSLLGYFL